jgi:hypothetical protein
MLLALLLAQGAVDLRPAFQKFDRLQSTCTIRTEVKASNGRESAYTLTLELAAETEKSEGGATTFDCGVSRLRIEGTLDGRKLDADWSKGSGWRGDAKVAGIERPLEKGWKMTLAAGKGTSTGDAFLEFGDLLPVLNPGALLGYPVPPPAEPVAVEKGWPAKPVVHAHMGGYSLKVAGFFDYSDGAAGKLSGVLSFGRAETEVPVDGAANVKGSGLASMEIDMKTKRPKKGASSAKLVVTQGGLKRELSQVIEFEMR